MADFQPTAEFQPIVDLPATLLVDFARTMAMLLAEACEKIGHRHASKTVTLSEHDLSSMAHEARHTAATETYTDQQEADHSDDSDDDKSDVEDNNAEAAAASSGSANGGAADGARSTSGNMETSSQTRTDSKRQDLRTARLVIDKNSEMMTLGEFRKAPRHTWVIAKNRKSNRWICVESSVY